VTQVGGVDILVAIGGDTGGPRRSTGAESADLDELCIDDGESPTDLWTRPLRRAAAASSAISTASGWATEGKHLGSSSTATSFLRSVIAFPPRPRCGFSLTPLEETGRRQLLFGGYSGPRGGRGRCLADLHVLEFANEVEPSKPQPSEAACLDCSDSEPEDIFFASDYRVEVAALRASRAVSAARASTAVTPAPQKVARAASRAWEADESSGSDSSDDETVQGDVDRRMGPAVLPRSMQEVRQSLGNTARVKMMRQQGSSEGTDQKSGRLVDGSVRWRVAMPGFDDDEAGEEPKARVGHTAVLVTPTAEGQDPVVIIFGGLAEAGMLLGDTHEVRIHETEDQSLETAWCCVDDGKDGGAETCPWSSSAAPSSRACHSAVFWEQGACMVIFGGLGLGMEGEPRVLGDTWTLQRPRGSSREGGTQNAQNSSGAAAAAAHWLRPTVQGGIPAKRWGHGAVVLGGANGGGSQMLICGGTDSVGKALSDCWILDLEAMRWDRLEDIAPTYTPAKPSLTMAWQPAPSEVGHCTATWSMATQEVIVWSQEGFWTWKEPENLQRERVMRQKQQVSPQSSLVRGSTESCPIEHYRGRDAREEASDLACEGVRPDAALPEREKKKKQMHASFSSSSVAKEERKKMRRCSSEGGLTSATPATRTRRQQHPPEEQQAGISYSLEEPPAREESLGSKAQKRLTIEEKWKAVEEKNRRDFEARSSSSSSSKPKEKVFKTFQCTTSLDMYSSLDQAAMQPSQPRRRDGRGLNQLEDFGNWTEFPTPEVRTKSKSKLRPAGGDAPAPPALSRAQSDPCLKRSTGFGELRGGGFDLGTSPSVGLERAEHRGERRGKTPAADRDRLSLDRGDRRDQRPAATTTMGQGSSVSQSSTQLLDRLGGFDPRASPAAQDRADRLNLDRSLNPTGLSGLPGALSFDKSFENPQVPLFNVRAVNRQTASSWSTSQLTSPLIASKPHPFHKSKGRGPLV